MMHFRESKMEPTRRTGSDSGGRFFVFLFLLFAGLLPLSVAPEANAQNPPEPAAGNTNPKLPRPQVIQDLVYWTPAEGEPLRADVFLPATWRWPRPDAARNDRCPTVLLVHGGGWTTGNKWTMQSLAFAMAEQGLAAVTINYRLAPAHRFPSQIDDVRKAYQWTLQQADRYGFDHSRVALFGYSAGAHLVSMIGTLADEPTDTQRSTSQLEPSDPLLLEPIRPAAIVAGGTPCDFQTIPPNNPMFSYFLGGTRAELPDVYRLASPVALVSAGDVPVYFYHGTGDLMVPIEPCREFCDAQRRVNVLSQFKPVEQQGHLLTFIDVATRQDAIDYLKDRIGPPITESLQAPEEPTRE